MNNAPRNQRAQDRYDANRLEALGHAAELLELLTTEEAAPNWADVGTMAEVNQKLAEAVAFLKGEELEA